ncbi:SMC-Scp complex subunit ScpB, partial [Planctomycetota bacterium]
MAEQDTKKIVEAVLFSSAEPLALAKLSGVIDGVDGRAVHKAITELNEDYEREGRAFHIQEIAGGFQLMTRPEFAPWVDKLQKVERKSKLSQAALEALALIAHRQPITRAEIESIRGVQCGDVLRSLIEKRLVKIAGRKDAPGRPLLYGTTRYFLEHFGLSSVDDLGKLG